MKSSRLHRRLKSFLCLTVLALFGSCSPNHALGLSDPPSEAEFAAIEQAEKQRIEVINKVFPSVVAIYGNNRAGGGSGVIIHPSGLAVTNHHVIQGAGVSGFGGLADGKLYPWVLIGTDPGGDAALIQLSGQEQFPYSPLGDSDTVKVGDWAIAMGNPFLLAEDQRPTVTLGVVSGVKRYQYGSGKNELVYGNCIQVDTSINPGNSGGPLFNMRGEVIGINGRISLQDRGRVNVGLGYAISSNQIKNFVPELLATKLVEHGTLDARFGKRDGKVVCESINTDSEIAKAGLELGDELLTFQGEKIKSSNHFTNLICTLPENWPATLEIKKADGTTKTLSTRLFGLPYQPPPPMPQLPPNAPPEQKEQFEQMKKMVALMAATPGSIRDEALNSRYANLILDTAKSKLMTEGSESAKTWLIEEQIQENGQATGKLSLWLTNSNRFELLMERGDKSDRFGFDGKEFWTKGANGSVEKLSATTARSIPEVGYASSLALLLAAKREGMFEKIQLDGGDLAAGRSAFRLRCLDQSKDWFYIWFNGYDGSGKLDWALAKSANNEDLAEKGVVYAGELAAEGIRIPAEQRIVEGPQERELYRLVVDKVSIASDLPTQTN